MPDSSLHTRTQLVARQPKHCSPVRFAFVFVPLVLFMVSIVHIALVSAQVRPTPAVTTSASVSLAFDTSLLNTMKQPQTVVDYFLLLPEALFDYKGKTAPFDTKVRQTVLGVTNGDSAKLMGYTMFAGAVEVKNKYLIVNTPDGADGYSFSVALWTLSGTVPASATATTPTPTPTTATTKRSKKATVTAQLTAPQTLIGFCKRRWEQHATTSVVQFFTFNGKQWREVTASVFPTIQITEFFQWSQLKRYPALRPPLDIELARAEQAIIVHLDMRSLKRMPELQPIADGLDRNVQTRTLELRLKNGVFAISNKF
jgi:hypothetical protein